MLSVIIWIHYWYNHYTWFILLSHLVDLEPVITSTPPSQSFTLQPDQTSVIFPSATATDDSGIPPTITYSTTTPGVTFLESGTAILANNIQQAGTIPVTVTVTDNNNNVVTSTFVLTIACKSIQFKHITGSEILSFKIIRHSVQFLLSYVTWSSENTKLNFYFDQKLMAFFKSKHLKKWKKMVGGWCYQH